MDGKFSGVRIHGPAQPWSDRELEVPHDVAEPGSQCNIFAVVERSEMPDSPPCLAIHHHLSRPGVDPIPPEWVDARVTIKDSVRPANIERRLWELSGGVRYCACGGAT